MLRHYMQNFSFPSMHLHNRFDLLHYTSFDSTFYFIFYILKHSIQYFYSSKFIFLQLHVDSKKDIPHKKIQKKRLISRQACLPFLSPRNKNPKPGGALSLRKLPGLLLKVSSFRFTHPSPAPKPFSFSTYLFTPLQY